MKKHIKKFILTIFILLNLTVYAQSDENWIQKKKKNDWITKKDKVEWLTKKNKKQWITKKSNKLFRTYSKNHKTEEFHLTERVKNEQRTQNTLPTLLL